MTRVRVLAVAAVALVLASCSWSHPGGNAGRTGANELDNEITAANVGSLAVDWRGTDGESPVISSKYLYVRGQATLEAYRLDGPALCAAAQGQPRTCEPDWFAPVDGLVGQPVLDGETVFVVAASGGHWVLSAFHADGSASGMCPPGGCAPIWTATWGDAPTSQAHADLAVADGRVYVNAQYDGSTSPPNTWAFDARGAEGCTPGPPRTCTPLFRAPGRGFFARTITVGSGRLFVPVDYDAVLVFDARGLDGCGAGVCQPLYELAGIDGESVSVAEGTAYSAVAGTVRAFDAEGQQGCGGAPRICQPIWTGQTLPADYALTPIVAAGKVFVVTSVAIEAFDADGVEGCVGQPAVCSRLWHIDGAQLAGGASRASANGSLLFVTGVSLTLPGITGTGHLHVFDLAGQAQCGGTPRTCSPLASFALGTRPVFVGPPAVAFGRIVIAPDAGTGPIEVLSLPG